VRKGAFISVGATSYSNLFTGSIATMKSWYNTLDIEYADVLLVPGMDSYNASSGRQDLLSRAQALGRQLVEN